MCVIGFATVRLLDRGLPLARRPSISDPGLMGGGDRMRLERVITELPAGFDVLRAEARAEGYRHVDRLADEWRGGTARFDPPGGGMIAGHLGGGLGGGGGLPATPPHTGRA